MIFALGAAAMISMLIIGSSMLNCGLEVIAEHPEFEFVKDMGFGILLMSATLFVGLYTMVLMEKK